MVNRQVTPGLALQSLTRDLAHSRSHLAAAQRQVSALEADLDRLTRQLGQVTEPNARWAQRHLVAAMQDTTAGLDRGGDPLGPVVGRFAEAAGGQFAVALDNRGRCVVATDMTAAIATHMTARGAADQVVGTIAAGVGRATLIENPAGTGAVLAAPMWGPDRRRVGTLAATCATPAASETEALIELARSFAALAALVVAQHDNLDLLAHFARRDVVTGCLQRRELDRVIARELSISARTGRAHSICFLDLDDFKSVNDTRGHLEGDRVLATVGQALRDHARDYDHVGRYGGDEFVIVLPATDSSDAQRGSRHLIAAIEEATRNIGQPVSASVGVSSWHAGLTSRDMLQAADERMRSAKGAPRQSAVQVRDLNVGAPSSRPRASH